MIPLRLAAASLLVALAAAPAAAQNGAARDGAACRALDSAAVERIKPLLDRADAPTTAFVRLAVNHLSAARQHCRSGRIEQASELYGYLDHVLVGFRSGQASAAE